MLNNKISLLLSSGFKIIDETDKYVLGHLYERAYLVEKSSEKEILLGEFYGDSNCGLISRENDWAIASGEH